MVEALLIVKFSRKNRWKISGAIRNMVAQGPPISVQSAIGLKSIKTDSDLIDPFLRTNSKNIAKP